MLIARPALLCQPGSLGAARSLRAPSDLSWLTWAGGGGSNLEASGENSFSFAHGPLRRLLNGPAELLICYNNGAS